MKTRRKKAPARRKATRKPGRAPAMKTRTKKTRTKKTRNAGAKKRPASRAGAKKRAARKPAKKAARKKPSAPINDDVRAGMRKIHALIGQQFYSDGKPGTEWAKGLGANGEKQLAAAEKYMRARCKK